METSRTYQQYKGWFLTWVLVISVLLVSLQANDRVEKAMKTYVKELEKAREKVLETYESEIKKAMNDKDLDSANSIKKEMSQWKSKELSKVPEEVSFGNKEESVSKVDKVDQNFSVRERELLEKRWKMQLSSNYSYYSWYNITFNRDRTVRIYLRDEGYKTFFWKIVRGKLGLFADEGGKKKLWCPFYYLHVNKTWVSMKKVIDDKEVRFKQY